MTSFSSIILAAGQGTRMRSPLPKGLHPVAGVPMLCRVIQSVKAAGASEVRVVVGYGEKMIRQIVEPMGVVCMKQQQPLGTGDAVLAAQPQTLSGDVLIINGDHPLVEGEDIVEILQAFRCQKTDLSVGTCLLKKPGCFGRVVRHSHQLQAIVESKEASKEVKKIKEVNTGIYVTSGEILSQYLPQLKPLEEKEYCLTDLISLLRENNHKMGTIPTSPRVAFGVNTQRELAQATKRVFKKVLKKHLKNGVVVIDPKTVCIEESVEIGSGTVIYPGVCIKGPTSVGNYCVIEPHCFLLNSIIGDSVQIKAGCYFESVSVKTKAVIGPYARLRPETTIGQGATVGNFVEMKKVSFGDGAKASHLTYLGDAVVGEETNVGCGTITCNYGVDKKKHLTQLGKGVFIGSGTQLVAPVNVGDHSYVGAGSVITKDIPERSLSVSRSRQIVKRNYSPKDK